MCCCECKCQKGEAVIRIAQVSEQGRERVLSAEQTKVYERLARGGYLKP